ncbi:ausB [Aspergillus calidoustus]|uniref:FAD-binding monooxygenase ausB n=1 Tax=Aspergillus calidoustus TaxID=454130 RepID=AUSB_ASPCI|nr:RecName: Full=FAD-binding monooxygenase ausB; AltName: Full=Austinoid biosynthesis cluster protein B [Aspergillus calidoustus]CEL11269.1 ausB [Aspergillus calidoustus]
MASAPEVESVKTPDPASTKTQHTSIAEIHTADQTWNNESNTRLPPNHRHHLRDTRYDPWTHNGSPPAEISKIPPRAKVLILGAGYGGLLFAVRLLEAGFQPSDILLVDAAHGFGGTWYWNRYPGLMCDIESYIYMPLLEETGYIPSAKYVPGEELRSHAERIAQHWGLGTRTGFGVRVEELRWDEKGIRWDVRGGRTQDPTMRWTCTADFVIIATGTLNRPRVPDLAGLDMFTGHVFHTARWDYNYTGGAPGTPALPRLDGKRVAVIGTGSTAIQIIPQLAKSAEQLFVFQRTPASVGLQRNRPTDREWWEKTIQNAAPGWQRRRAENFNAWISTPHEVLGIEEDLISDGWTSAPSFAAAIGGPLNLAPDFLHRATEVDAARRRIVHQVIETTVKDRRTAEALLNHAHGWCKRPCFHEGYFETYNLANTLLVDARDHQLHLTHDGVQVGDTVYPVDLIVLATGYELGSLCPATRAQVRIVGVGGQQMEEKWARPATLHGIMTRGFPNLFFPGTSQAGVTANQSYMFDRAAEHVAYILHALCLRRGTETRLRLQPTVEAEEQWATRSVDQARAFAATRACAVGSYTIAARYESADGAALARHLPWGEGMASYVRVLEQWREAGTMEGLEIVSE